WRPMSPLGVRVSLAPGSTAAGLDPIVVEPSAIVAPRNIAPGASPAGPDATAVIAPLIATRGGAPDATPSSLVNGEPSDARISWLDDERATFTPAAAGAAGDPGAPWESGATRRLLLLPPVATRSAGRGIVRREIVVDGWRVEVEVEPAALAALRERARRGREVVGQSGPTEVRAIIPGVVVSVSVAAGDAVTAGQQLLAIEAMKMQNELRAPRDGTIERVAVGQGQTIEVGDLLLVIT
ncbi:MAG: biotin/lipoyl-containing protein, partial [Candidatus Limnocylindrales bacterium]